MSPGSNDSPVDGANETDGRKTTSTLLLAGKNLSALEGMLELLHAMNGLSMPLFPEESEEQSPPSDRKPAP